MKKYSTLILFLLFSIASSSNSFSQTYTTESKNCGSCQKKVSNNSRVGMYCPHCGVRWGYENETKKKLLQIIIMTTIIIHMRIPQEWQP